MASSRLTGTNESRWTGSAWEAGANSLGASGYDYTAISTWEAATDVDLVTAQVSPVLEMYTDRTANTLMGGATASATYFRTLRAASTVRHGGNPAAGVTLSTSNAASYYTLLISEAYLQVADLKISCTCSNTNTAAPVLIVNSAGVRIIGCLLTSSNSGTGSSVGTAQSNAVAFTVLNSIVYGCESYGLSGRGASALFCNNVVVGCGGYGFSFSTAACVWQNNIAQNNAGGDYNGDGATGTTHNLASDTTAPKTGTYWDSKTVSFVDAGNNDYRLTNDADAVDLGTDLSSTFDDDIAYTTRPSGAAWDLGAFEYVQAGFPTALLRRRPAWATHLRM